MNGSSAYSSPFISTDGRELQYQLRWVLGKVQVIVELLAQHFLPHVDLELLNLVKFSRIHSHKSTFFSRLSPLESANWASLGLHLRYVYCYTTLREPAHLSSLRILINRWPKMKERANPSWCTQGTPLGHHYWDPQSGLCFISYLMPLHELPTKSTSYTLLEPSTRLQVQPVLVPSSLYSRTIVRLYAKDQYRNIYLNKCSLHNSSIGLTNKDSQRLTDETHGWRWGRYLLPDPFVFNIFSRNPSGDYNKWPNEHYQFLR